MPASRLPDPAAVRTILAIQVSRIGDTLLSTPTLRAISTHFPQARLTVLGHPNRCEVFEHIPFIHAVGPITKKTALWQGWMPGKPYDLAFVFGYDEPLVRYALRVARGVVAMRQQDAALNARLLHAASEPAPKSRHAVYMQHALVEDLNLPIENERLAYTVTDAESAWARQTLADKQRAGAFPMIGLQIASFPTKGYRDWPVENFKALTDLIRARYPQAHFLIFGGPLERERTLSLAGQLGAAATHFAGTLSLRQTAALMNCLDYYIGVDTGPTHIMGALGRPMMAMYHPSSPAHMLKPLQHPALTAVDHPLAGQVGPEASMAGLTVESVWAQLEPALANLKAA